MSMLKVEIDDEVMARFKDIARKQQWRGDRWWPLIVEDALMLWADENDPNPKKIYGRNS